jgi:hypothetical protein
MRWTVYVDERGWPSADVVISTAETEVLIGDKLAGNLGVVNSPGSGRRKFADVVGTAKGRSGYRRAFTRRRPTPGEGSGTKTYR